MPHRNALTLATVLLLGAIAPPHVAADDRDPTRDWPKPDLRAGRSEAELGAAIGAYVQTLSDANHFSGTILAAKAGQPIVARAYGLANVDAKTPNTVDTAFNIGSINKELTKVAIAQLAEAGKLSLDDTVRKHLPDPRITAADKITIQQLLEHRSGMGNIFGAKYDAAPPSRLRELGDFVPLFAGEPLAFEPGASQRYSNAGYVVLGLIVERLSGQTYRDYVQKRIFAPAGMTRSGFWTLDERVAHRATGYTLRGGLRERAPNTASLPGRPSSAGGAFATAGDLLRFHNALLADKLLSRKWTNWMLGGSFDDRPRMPARGVAGGAPGVSAAVELEDGWTVIALSNFDPPAATATATGVLDILRGRPRAADSEPGGGPRIRRTPPAAPAATELTADVAVPAQRVGHLFAVEAKVNGKGPFRFAIDSGSGGMLSISTRLQQELQLSAIGEVMAGDPSGKNPHRRPLVRVDSVELGGARFRGVDASVRDARGPDGADGVIGLSLFAGLTATLDYPRQQLRLGRQPVAQAAPHVVPFTVEHGIPVIEVDAGGVSLKADVDTGSPAVLTVPSSWSTKLTFTGAPRVVGKARTVSNEFEVRGADLAGELRVAGFAQRSPRIDLVDLFPVANLGSRFLQEYAVTFDLPNRRLLLAR
jgi:CubicO group peptidase (beta-lactamase class C family)